MRASNFCQIHGIQIITEYKDDRFFLMHVIDTDRQLIKSGKREGVILKKTINKEIEIDKAYGSIMDVILEKLYS